MQTSPLYKFTEIIHGIYYFIGAGVGVIITGVLIDLALRK